ncbi:multidrug transporter subunit MdtO [Shimwellia blattae]|uniref:Putative multidrug resistance protein MdtO n=1 Tax=Shimwellia blattae (strain ATCC 29907 / DSM 4481 / JCM 1650 / NBRC 105725 / CDC 9005-74) TaxID=630626 RepID=I2BC66_SHIBC|nr:multidrug transporter subunit MdtO [Shimwellia blattae]AFJ48120.1 putative multidrug resistance protein MdtO [Shimwellia blattae DSM 4481 = NBRC 105725]GAB81893.1 multidrug resistance protein MdtO [Shimwellia blattae DSM 4481 = NBRC 105725]VDY65619.1 multidrug efflux system protein MdtO [Shimwellia blattae]VEC25116.1 multidrug efflux system protein MdtO [Shimwellia blattae]
MQRLWSFLVREWQPTPGRGSYTLRLTVTCALVITLFMTLQIPFLAVGLIVVFYASQPNVVMIKLVGVVFFVTITCAIGLILLIFKWTYDYPLIRLVAASLLFCCAIYLMRILGKLGLAFFVVALAVIYAQTFPSMTSQSEILVRLLLWLWVAINSALLVTILVNACFQQAFPAYQFRSRLSGLLGQSADQLARFAAGQPLKPPALTDMARQAEQLALLLKLSRLSGADTAGGPVGWSSLMVAGLRCAYLVSLLRPASPTPELQAQARQLSAALTALAAGKGTSPLPAATAATSSNGVLLAEMTGLLWRLAQGEVLTLPAAEKAPLMAPDAWRNPAYAHFTLKTLLSTLLCYVFYVAADWQGIHTIMLSCVIVAQPGLGATMQKALLRLGGALVASGLALLCMVFIQPHTDTLSGLLLMALPVMALGAWLAGGSERIAYAGIQIAFTFSLAFLNGFGPQTDLSEVSDRLLGILLGGLVASLVHIYLWPESEAPALRQRLVVLFRLMADYLPGKNNASVLPLIHTLNQTGSLLERVAAEPTGSYAHPYSEARLWPARHSFELAQQILIAGDGYRLQASPRDDTLARSAALLADYARYIEQPGAPRPALALRADATNPWAASLTGGLAALPEWATARPQPQTEK